MTQDNFTLIYPGPCGCPRNCGSHGQCVASACMCEQGYLGSDCSTRSATIIGECPSGTNLFDCSGKDREWKPAVSWPFAEDKYGWDHPLFNRSTITEVRLTLEESDLVSLLDPRNRDTKKAYNCAVAIRNAAVWQKVSGTIRVQGNGSRNLVQKSWKLKFSEHVFGARGMILKSGVMEPTLLREIAAIDMFTLVESPVYRGSHYQLSINGMLFGAHLGLELYDKQFLKSRFPDTPDGDLYKGVTTFRYFGELNATTQSVYEQIYHLEEGTGNWSDIVELTRAVRGNATLEQISQLIDVDSFLRTYAVEVVGANWDGTWNGNNYYLYKPSPEAKFVYLRHDLDICLGAILNGGSSKQPNVDLSVADIWNWTSSGPEVPFLGPPSPLVARLMVTEPYRTQFKKYVLTVSQFLSKMQFDTAFVQPLIGPDVWRALDLVWMSSDGIANVNSTLTRGYSKWMGLNEYVARRVQSIAQQTRM